MKKGILFLSLLTIFAACGQKEEAAKAEVATPVVVEQVVEETAPVTVEETVVEAVEESVAADVTEATSGEVVAEVPVAEEKPAQ